MHDTKEIERDLLKTNVLCAMSEGTVSGPFFFEGVNVSRYLEILTNCVFPQLAAECDGYLFQQDYSTALASRCQEIYQ